MPKLNAQSLILSPTDSNLPVRHTHLHIDEQPRHCILRLQTADLELAEAAGATFGALEMPGPGKWVKTDLGVRIVWTSHLEWLFFAPWEMEDNVIQQVSRLVSAENGCITLISDSRISFRIQGRDASVWLSKSCTFDADRSVFLPGMATIAKFNQQAAMIVHDAESTYLIYFDSPLAKYIAKTLIETAREFA